MSEEEGSPPKDKFINEFDEEDGGVVVGAGDEEGNTNEDLTVKVICLGDSAVGKSKLLERFLSDKFKPQQVSTFALTLYRYRTKVGEEPVNVDFWDTAGQERFENLHPSYYHLADACIMVFDATRKATYKNLTKWYNELRQYRPEIPCFCAVNKIDSNKDLAGRAFAFPQDNGIPTYYVSAATGSNVNKMFRDAIAAAAKYRKNPTHWSDQVLIELDRTIKEDEEELKNQNGEGGGDDGEGTKNGEEKQEEEVEGSKHEAQTEDK